MNDDYPPGAYYVTEAEAKELRLEWAHRQIAALKEQLREAVRLLEDCEPYSRLTAKDWYALDVKRITFIAQHSDIVKEIENAN